MNLFLRDCISRYIYIALQSGSIMRNWTNDERMMIACCDGGTCPVIFKIRRLDHKVVKVNAEVCNAYEEQMKNEI